MKKYTKKMAREIIEANKDNTAFFDGSVTMDRMYEMLRYDSRFGEAETQVIIAALRLAGANFPEEVKVEEEIEEVEEIEDFKIVEEEEEEDQEAETERKMESYMVKKIQRMCIENELFTRGTTKQYHDMFEMVREGKPLRDIADAIANSSDPANYRSIGQIASKLDIIRANAIKRFC